MATTQPIPLWLRLGYAGAGPLRLIRRTVASKRRILIILGGSLGDTLLSTGATAHLIRHFRDSSIELLVSESSRSLVCTLPGVCKIWTLEFHRLGDPSLRCRLERLLLAIGLGGRTYEQVIVLGPVPNDLILAISAAVRPKGIWHFTAAAESSATASQPQRSQQTASLEHAVQIQPGAHELDDLTRFLSEMGVTAPGSIPLTRTDILPEIHFTPEDQKRVDRLIRNPSSRLSDEVFRLALCPGARFKQKDWGLEKFKALLDELRRPPISDSLFGERCLEIVMMGGPEDRARFQALATHAAQADSIQIRSLTGELNPRQSILFLKHCQACIGNDTFGLHAAIVAGTPSVVIMGGGDYGRWIPWANPDQHRMVYQALPCQGCRWQCTRADYDCIRQITVEQVIHELAQALGRRAGDGAT